MYMDGRIDPVTLHGRHVRLEPLRAEHAGGLLVACDEDALKYMMGQPRYWDLGGFMQYVEELNGDPHAVAYAIIELANGRVAGTTSFLDIRVEHRGLEIGRTWLGAEFRGTMINPEMKLLMLGHAFEGGPFKGQGAARVQLKTDLRNLRSQRAIEKLGAAREGVLRNHVIMPDGYIRSTVMYSILPEEWAGVRARLEERLGETFSGKSDEAS
ncbi:MAG: GNAT family protein [Phycisphaerales bacterium]|jgi:RimJ/RimL family protein N-acetyltransferase|nr:GNAT family protein [Phycisphaerales bacterium]